ncbi:MAG: S8 family serine peptidase, partial [Propionibacteriales bacterium]|nr:S8 family serine peptidase [Propionibacteriales bacterium]
PGGKAIDVVNLSLGYYHETPDDKLEDPTLYDLLETLGTCGTAVVCSAGNDATARELYPAAFAPWRDGDGKPVRDDCLPVVSVGARNPNDTVALFSNTGPWVRCYDRGAALLSTIPKFQGGLEPPARTTADNRVREGIDPDDFSGGFALWSGTSFAAPLVAGKIAAQLVDALPAAGAGDSKKAAVSRGWKAVAEATGIGR